MTSRAPGPEPLLTFDWSDRDGPAQAVVAAVSDAADEDSVDVAPLYDVVDPDALDNMLSSRGPGRAPLDGSIAFEYLGHDVVLTGHGKGYVYDEAVDVQPPVTAGRAAEGVDE